MATSSGCPAPASDAAPLVQAGEPDAELAEQGPKDNQYKEVQEAIVPDIPESSRFGIDELRTHLGACALGHKKCSTCHFAAGGG